MNFAVPELLFTAVTIAGLSIGALAFLGSRLLLGWYLREVRRVKITEQPDDAIVTYPLA